MLPWIFLLLSLGAWWIVLTTRSMTELVVALIAGVVLFLLGFFGLVSARVGQVTRTQGAREQAMLLTTKAKAGTSAGPSRSPDRGGPTPIGDGGSGLGPGPWTSDRDPPTDEGPVGDDGGADGGGGD
jgi:hypothetical protein